MHRCYTPCIYYYEIHSKDKNPIIRCICDYRDGEEIKNIPHEERIDCEHFKTHKDIKQRVDRLIK